MLDSDSLIILQHLLVTPEYRKKVLPYLELSYFQDSVQRALLSSIKEHNERYDVAPTTEQLLIRLGREALTQEEFDGVKDTIENHLAVPPTTADLKWLEDETAKFIDKGREHNFVLDYIHRTEKGEALPSTENYARLLTPFSFEPKQLGLNLKRDARKVAEYNLNPRNLIEFSLRSLNELTGGGISRKTLNLILAATNVGKSLILCHLTAEYALRGHKVLYISLEMDQESIYTRIAANLLDTDISVIEKYSPDQFHDAMENRAVSGDFQIVELPTSSAGIKEFRVLLDDLKANQNFVPDILVVDYLGTMEASETSKKQGSFHVGKDLAEALRDFAKERDIVVWSAVQTNREGYNNPPQLEMISESAAINNTADVILGLYCDERNLPGTMTISTLKLRRRQKPASTRKNFDLSRAKMKIAEWTGPSVAEIPNPSVRPRGKSSAVDIAESRRPTFARLREGL